MNVDRTAPKEQSDLCPYCLQYRLPKTISKQEEQATKVVTDGPKFNGILLLLNKHIRGTFGKFLAWYFISVNDVRTLSCLVSFQRTISPLCYGKNLMRIL